MPIMRMPIIGSKYGRWTVVSEETTRPNNTRYWDVQCECGERRFVNSSRLWNGRATTCEKCAANDKRGSKYIPVVGAMYGDWKVISPIIVCRSDNSSACFQVECTLCSTNFIRHAESLVKGETVCCRKCFHKRNTINKYLEIGSRFGMYTVIEGDTHKFYNSENTQHHLIHVECDCGSKNYVSIYNLRRGKTTHCKKCTSTLKKKNFEDISGAYLSSIRSGAKSRNLKFIVEPKYLWHCFLNQNKQCSLTGISINLDPLWGTAINIGCTTQTASLDRIDSSKGYIEGNVQWVHKVVNIMKSNFSDQEFINWCHLVANHNPTNNTI